MHDETPPTPTEMQLDALSAAYGLPPEAVVDLALRNLSVIVAFQMGREQGTPEALFRLLLAPALAPAAEAHGAEPQPEPVQVHPDPEQAPPSHRAILRAAAQMVEPFTSREVAARIGGHSGSVGQVLASSRWPCEAPRVGRERRWLPRPSAG